jgi:hypothetical protein
LSALCAALLAPVAVGARQQAQEEPHVADLSAEFSRLFPSKTALYVEVPHLATLVASIGIGDRLLELVNTRLAPPSPAGAKPAKSGGKTPAAAPAIGAKDLATLLDSSVALGFVRDGSFTDPTAAAVVVHLSSPEAVALLRDRVFARQGAPRSTTKVHGVEVVRMPGFSYAISGRSVLVGLDDNVDAVLDAATSSGPRLGDEPGFASAAAKHATGQDQLFVYAAGRSIGAFFGGFLSGARRGDGESKEAPAETALRTFIGLDAIVGLAAGVRFDADSARIRYDVELDRTHAGLVTAIADPPPIAFRSPTLLPADTARVTIFSLDAARIYDLMEQSFASVPAAPGGRAFSEDVAELERSLGVSIRNELIPALGTEVAYSGTLEALGREGASDEERSARPLSVVVLQVRDPEVLRKIIRLQVSPKPDAQQIQPLDYKGVELYEMPFVSAAIGKDFAILGQSSDVRRCLDAQETGSVLAKAPEFAARAGGWAGDTIMATYGTAVYHEASEREENARLEAIRKQTPDGQAFEMLSLSSVLTSAVPSLVQRDGSGVHWESSTPVDPLGRLVGYVLTEALKPGATEPPKPDPHDRVVGLLYEVASAEARFREEKDRYASMEELAGEEMLVLDDVSSSAKSAGYVLNLTPLGTGDGSRFELVATPVDYGKPARLSFFMDESFVIRAADKGGAPAGESDTPFTYDMGGQPEPPPDVTPQEPAPDGDPNE